MSNSIEELAGTDFLLVTGSNTTEAHPVISLRMKRAVKNGAKLVVVDPRKIELDEVGDAARSDQGWDGYTVLQRSR